MLDRIFKLANLLDSKGFIEQANQLDNFGFHILTRLAFKFDDGSKKKQDLKDLDSRLEKIEQNIREKIVMDMMSGQRDVDPERFPDIFMQNSPINLPINDDVELSKEEEREMQDKIKEIIQEVVSEQVPESTDKEELPVDSHSPTETEGRIEEKEETTNVQPAIVEKPSPKKRGRPKAKPQEKAKEEAKQTANPAPKEEPPSESKKETPLGQKKDEPQKTDKKDDSRKRTDALTPIVRFFSITERTLESLFDKTNDDTDELSYRNRLLKSFKSIENDVDTLLRSLLKLKGGKRQYGFEPEEVADLLQDITLSGKDLDVNDDARIKDFIDAIISAESGISDAIGAKSKYSISVSKSMSKIKEALKAIKSSKPSGDKKEEKQTPAKKKDVAPKATTETKKEEPKEEVKVEKTEPGESPIEPEKPAPMSKEERAKQLAIQTINRFAITYIQGNSPNPLLGEKIKSHILENQGIKDSIIDVQKLLNLARKNQESGKIDKGMFYNKILSISKKMKDGIEERSDTQIGSSGVFVDALEQLDEIMSDFINNAKQTLSAKTELDMGKLIKVLDGFFNVTIKSKLP